MNNSYPAARDHLNDLMLTALTEEKPFDFFPLLIACFVLGLFLYLFFTLLRFERRLFEARSSQWKAEEQLQAQRQQWQQSQHRHYKLLGDLMHNAGNPDDPTGPSLDSVVGKQIGDIGHYLRRIGNDPIEGELRNEIHFLEGWRFNDPGIEQWLEKIEADQLVALSVSMLSSNRTLEECLKDPEFRHCSQYPRSSEMLGC